MVSAALAKIPALSTDDIDDLILGCGMPGGEQGFNMARNVAVKLGLDHLPGVTVTRYCSSSVQTTRMAMHAIRSGESQVCISAGVESVTSFRKGSSDTLPGTHDPAFAEAEERSARTSLGGVKWTDPRDSTELPDVYIAMGQTAENVAQVAGITREDQDRWAVRSQQRAESAIKGGFFEREIDPITLADGTIVNADDCPRPGVTYEAVSQLKPVFRPDGTVTAGNCCPLNDGAAAIVMMSDAKAKELALTPLARIVATGVSGLSPEIMGLGPIESTRKAAALAGMSIDDIDLYEINEAFASQVLGSARELGLDEDRLNVSGGAIAVGHPFGMTGARITATLLNNLRTHDKETGLVTMCVGGGQGMAMILERLS